MSRYLDPNTFLQQDAQNGGVYAGILGKALTTFFGNNQEYDKAYKSGLESRLFKLRGDSEIAQADNYKAEASKRNSERDYQETKNKNYNKLSELLNNGASNEELNRNLMPINEKFYVPYNNVGNTGVSINEADGTQIVNNQALNTLFNRVENSKINENNAQANNANASANEHLAKRNRIDLGLDHPVILTNDEGNYLANLPTAGGNKYIGKTKNTNSGVKTENAKMLRNIINTVIKDEYIAPENKQKEIETRYNDYTDSMNKYFPQPISPQTSQVIQNMLPLGYQPPKQININGWKITPK